jgi:protein-disulfide isomerase
MSFEEKKDDTSLDSNQEDDISETTKTSAEEPSTINESNSEINEQISHKEPASEYSTKKSTPMGMIVALVAVVAVAAFFAGSYFSSIDSDVVTKSELDDAISRLEAKLERAQVQPSLPPAQPVRISADDDPIRGDPNAPITIIEFSDFQCPFCARFHVQTLPSLLEEYIESGKVKLVYRDFPIQSIHPNALPAAVAAECANEQGKYWEYHDTLFEKQNSWARQDSNSAIITFTQYAQDIELEMEQFNSCLGTGKYLQEVQNDLSDGRDYDITGTPGFFIGNDEIGFVKLNGAQPFESFKRIIDAQLDA